MKYLIVTFLSVFIAALCASCLPSIWAEREFFATMKTEVGSWENCPGLAEARQKMQATERKFVKHLQKTRAFLGLAKLGRVGYDDIIIQKNNDRCFVGYVMEVDLRPLLVFPYVVHSVRRLEK